MENQISASVIGTGTELVHGPTINRNALWISERLYAFGLPTASHLTVPDDKDLIIQALQFAVKNSNYIFITGGLGPTQDDFTRDVVSEFLGLPLEWNDQSWLRITEALKNRGLTPKETHKQQCFFPKESRILINSAGTADGFMIDKVIHSTKKTFFILPGPPAEIEAIWKDHLQAFLSAELAHIDPLMTLTWNTIGLVESEVAERFDRVLSGCNYEKGYRVHLPYVDVKLSLKKSNLSEAKKWIEAVETELQDIIVSRQGEDLVQSLCQLLEKTDGVFVSDLTHSVHLFQRFNQFNKLLIGAGKFNYGANFEPKNLSPKMVHLSLDIQIEHKAVARLNFNNQTFVKELDSPKVSHKNPQRELQYFSESAIIFWLQVLRTSIK